MPNLFETLRERGFVQDATPGAAARLARGPVVGYVGFDPTSDSLHVGNLVPVMGLAWLQRTGGTPIVLVGGGTGMVGDPSGKRSERPVLPVERIDANAEAIRRQLARFVGFGGANAARVRNNADWLRPLSLMEFLRDTGKHFTVGYMLQKESVRSRLETGISYTEFSYMLIQAYDFWHLFRTERCELQMGGSDQWGNITAGIELIGRREGAEAHGLVFPLLTTASGAKFGKSESGNVWLDPAKTSPYQFYQFWVNTEDDDVERFLRLFTFKPLDEIAAIVAEHRRDPSRRVAQRALADDVTARVHGDEDARRAREASRAIFGRPRGGGPDGGAGLAEEPDYAALAGAVPNHPAARAELEAGLPVVDALVRVGLASSKGDARRGIEGRGFAVNEVVVTDATRRLTPGDLRQDRYVLLRKGKKTYAMLVVD
ncbi:MAG TPA: tyrosine--tRNA ligase [Gemmatimonadales bacterium]|nr:tyrosine--tRNA ligase [Gemmatimonadales bacterium]